MLQNSQPITMFTEMITEVIQLCRIQLFLPFLDEEQIEEVEE